MSASKNISSIVLASLIGLFSINPVLAVNSDVVLRANVNENEPAVKLTGGINITEEGNNITLSLRDSDVKQVLRMIADKAGKNIVFHSSVEGKITLDLVDSSLNKAFEYVLKMNELKYWVDGNTLIIASKEDSEKLALDKKQMQPIKIKHVNANKVAEFLNANIFKANNPNIDVSEKPIVVTNPKSNSLLVFGTDADIALASKVVKYLDVEAPINTFTVNHAQTSDIANLICSMVFPSDGEESSSDSSSSSSDSSSDSGSGAVNALACSSSDSDEEESSSEDNDLASFSANAYSVFYNSGLKEVTLQGGTQEQIAMVSNIVKKFDKKEPQVYIEMSIIELSEAASKELSAKVDFSRGKFSLSADAGKTAMEPYGFYTNGASSFSKQLNYNLTNIIENSKGKILANPKIIATNNKPSTVNISSEYVKTVTTEIITPPSGGLPYPVKNYETDEAGIELKLTPQISPNGYVNIDLKPTYTSISKQLYATAATEDAQDLVATLLNKRELELDDVRIKDGETLIIGGLLQENENKVTKKVPILGSIPVFGALFNANTRTKEKTELIIMITPRIINDDYQPNL